MPRLIHALPRYRRHASGQAIVEFNKRVHYLGPYRSAESRREYDRLIAEWLANNRHPLPATRRALTVAASPVSSSPPSEPQPELKLPPPGRGVTITVVELAARYWEHAQKHFIRHGRPTGTHENYRPCIRMLKELGDLPVPEFGPRLLKELLNKMIAAGQSRRYANDNLCRLRRIFKWGVSDELVSAEQLAALQTVEMVPVGAEGVVERGPVTAVADELVEATLPHLPRVVQAMVQLARLTGARPGEICMIRPVDINTTESSWIYRPERHKTEHHGKQRHVVIGPRGQEVLRPYLNCPPHAYCFSPAVSEAGRRRTSETNAAAGKQRSQARRRPPGGHYTNDSFRRAITRGCDLAFPPPDELTPEQLGEWQRKHRWSPNQLRHAAATEICSRFSLTAAKDALGHASVRTTERYVDPDMSAVKKVMQVVG